MPRPKTLIGVQEKYIATINAGIARWAHRKDGGHSGRIARGARHAAERQLRSLGFTQQQIPKLIQDSSDIAALERLLDVE